jgi:hypothetical protein
MAAPERPPATIESLTNWEDHGAIWRAVEVTSQRAVIELCSCYGEPIDLVQSSDPEVIAFVRRGPRET